MKAVLITSSVSGALFPNLK